ncbi:MAG: hypothetical protein OZ921_18495 [Sorangiineae bacterium]|nr:hypothetical protein [Polyangiaceae bacterium]MEB2324511.1 hypothetical protein [Sorangiineae bacterium]
MSPRGLRPALAGTLLGLAALAGCSGAPPAKGPSDVLADYARALEEGRTADAYALLSDEARRSLPFEAFARMTRESPEDAKAIAAALRRPSGAPLVTATVTAADGQTLTLVYEGDRWRIAPSAIDLYGQASPEQAVRAFVRAFENRRWDVLMRFVPDAKREGLDAARLQKAWDGEQKDEMQKLVQALAAALPTAKFEHLGDRATMAYGAGGTVELVREGGVWKLEELH